MGLINNDDTVLDMLFVSMNHLRAEDVIVGHEHDVTVLNLVRQVVGAKFIFSS